MSERDVIQQSTQPVTVEQLTKDFARCGLEPGQTMIVHTAMSKLGWVVGGAQAVIQALLNVVGPIGTLLMPTQTWKNLDPESGVHPVPRAWWPTIRDHWPAYDPATTPSIGMGTVAELFRTWPSAMRSQHPVRSFAALGPNAQFLIENHSLEESFGEASPVGRLYALDGYILLIGLDHGSNTSLHLAEHRARYPSKRYVQESSAILVDGVRQWISYSSPVLDGSDFVAIGAQYEAETNIAPSTVGQTTVRFMRQRPLVDWAVQWMERHRK